MTGTGRVRRGKRGDLPALRAIQTAVLAEPWTELLTVAVDGPPVLLVATEPTTDGEGLATLVGYALAVTDGDDTTGYLAELAVEPGSQGEGHGSALLSALVERLRESGVDRLRVTVRVVDDRARSFYREHGFERVERLPDRYESGDGLLLEREIAA